MPFVGTIDTLLSSFLVVADRSWYVLEDHCGLAAGPRGPKKGIAGRVGYPRMAYIYGG